MQLKEGAALQGGKYRILGVLGQGGFGITYLAEHTLLEKKVAIKEFFPKEYCDREENTSHLAVGGRNTGEIVGMLKIKFVKEAKNLSKLNHRNIVTIHDIFQENDTAYYVMEFVEGESLSQMIKEHGVLPEKKSLGYIRKIADAVGYMHSLSMNHLDLKPANIMIRSTDDEPVLIDFGLSKQYDANGGETSVSPIGISHGFAPIEQYRPDGVATFTPQTDVYALGATLFNMLTGTVPPHYSEILEDGLPALPEGVSTRTVNAIRHAMEIKKNNRPASMGEFISELDENMPPATPGAYAASPGKESRSMTPPSKTPPPPVIEKRKAPVSPAQEETVVLNSNVPKVADAKIDASDKGSLIEVNGVKFPMVHVKGGKVVLKESSFWGVKSMEVSVSDFEIGEVPVTRGMWSAVLFPDKAQHVKDKDHPITGVSFNQCVAFISKLNKKTGLKFRLPTESEWQYAAGGGLKADPARYSGSDDVTSVAWCDLKEGPYAVRSKSPNLLGLYDMSGNVCEWCLDWFAKYDGSVRKNYKGPGDGDKKVLKGGSYAHPKNVCEIRHRMSDYPDANNKLYGFRLVRVL